MGHSVNFTGPLNELALKKIKNADIQYSCDPPIDMDAVVIDAIEIDDEFMPWFSGSKKRILNQSKTAGEKLCDALEGMGTTFIKLGQFLATRPDIIGKELANDLEKLQDKLPPFSYDEAIQILKNKIQKLSE